MSPTQGGSKRGAQPRPPTHQGRLLRRPPIEASGTPNATLSTTSMSRMTFVSSSSRVEGGVVGRWHVSKATATAIAMLM
jgi:hypothetical protein